MQIEIEIDGETADVCSLDEFVSSNDAVPDEEIDQIAALAVGQVYQGGGGAACLWIVRRVS